MTTVEIEDDNGNTQLAFKTEEKMEIDKIKDGEIADVEGDYIFNTEDDLIRIQPTR